MKLSELLNSLIKDSDFVGTRSLSENTGIDKGFIDRARGGKNSLVKLDIVFHELTKDLEVEDFMLVRELIRKVRLREIKRD